MTTLIDWIRDALRDHAEMALFLAPSVGYLIGRLRNLGRGCFPARLSIEARFSQCGMGLACFSKWLALLKMKAADSSSCFVQRKGSVISASFSSENYCPGGSGPLLGVPELCMTHRTISG